jgi:hypothetical protein
MSYKDIILRNEEYAAARWWPHYAYHYTDMMNAVSILKSGILYSRRRAKELDLMLNDNAGRQVIDMTAPETAAWVRLYFRPLTPTQYYNEGLKHPDLRYSGDPNAYVPVPIFFFFHLEQLLADQNTRFSEGSEAGGGNPMFSGEAAFSDLDFKMIYRNGPFIAQDIEGRKREGSLRQSEILYPDKYLIDQSLAGIVCRNAEERTAFLNLLKDESCRLFNYWQPRIRVMNREIYYNNGLYVEECVLHDTDFSITFSDAYPRKQYAKKHIGDLQIRANIQFEWLHGNKVLDRKDFEWTMDYLGARPVIMRNVPFLNKAQELSVKLYLDRQLMCYRRFSLLKGGY